MAGCAADGDGRLGVDIRPEHLGAELGETSPERGFGGNGVMANTCTADPVTLPDIRRSRAAFMACGTADPVLLLRPEPLWLKEFGAKCCEASAEGSFGGSRVVASADAADTLCLLGIVRGRVAIVTCGTKGVMLCLAAEPFRLKQRRAEIPQTVAECRFRNERGSLTSWHLPIIP